MLEKIDHISRLFMRAPDLKAGEIIVLSSGEWSDYSVAGVFLVAQDFNFAEQSKAYQQDPTTKWDTGSGYAAWLTNHGFLMDLDAREWHYE